MNKINFINKKRIILISLLTSFLIIIFYFFSKGSPSFQIPSPEVNVVKIELKDVPLKFDYFGRAVGSKEVEVRAQISGILLNRIYTEGQFIKQGNILFKIDPAPYQAKFDQATAQLKQAEASVRQTEQAWIRTSDLYKKKTVSASDRDNALAAYDKAKAAFELGKAELTSAQINLNYTDVKSPISGFAGKENQSIGNLVDTTGDKSLLTSINQADPLYVDFNFSINDLSELQKIISLSNKDIIDKKISVEIVFENNSIYEHIGNLNFIDHTVDTQTGTIKGRAVIPNPDGKLLPGQFIRIIIKDVVKRNAIIIPKKAVMQGEQGTFVYCVDKDSKAQIRPIILGHEIEKETIVEQGLNRDDQIITEGMIKVQPNSIVRIKTLANTKPSDSK